MLMSYTILDMQSTSFILPKGILTHTSEVLFNSFPNFCCFGLVKASAYYGTYNECSFSFSNFGLNGYNFTLNSDNVLYNIPKFSLDRNIARQFDHVHQERKKIWSLQIIVGRVFKVRYVFGY